MTKTFTICKYTIDNEIIPQYDSVISFLKQTQRTKIKILWSFIDILKDVEKITNIRLIIGKRKTTYIENGCLFAKSITSEEVILILRSCKWVKQLHIERFLDDYYLMFENNPLPKQQLQYVDIVKYDGLLGFLFYCLNEHNKTLKYFNVNTTWTGDVLFTLDSQMMSLCHFVVTGIRIYATAEKLPRLTGKFNNDDWESTVAENKRRLDSAVAFFWYGRFAIPDKNIRKMIGHLIIIEGVENND